jgi:hypothetical protein
MRIESPWAIRAHLVRGIMVSSPVTILVSRCGSSASCAAILVAEFVNHSLLVRENCISALSSDSLSFLPIQCRAESQIAEPSFVDIVNQDRRRARQHIVRVQARPLLPASLLASGRFDSRRMFVHVRWSLLVLPSLLPSAVYTAWGIPGIPNACQAALSCGVRLMVRSAPRA